MIDPKVPGKLSALLKAMRLHTLPTGLAPVFFGLVAALWQLPKGASLPAGASYIFLCCVAVVMLLQIVSNLVNDIKDFEKGIDTHQRLGPPRALQQGWLSPREIRLTYRVLLVIAVGIGIYVCFGSSNSVLILGFMSAAAAYMYSGGPWPLSHAGLGEVLALVFFGPIASYGTAELLTQTAGLPALFVGLIPGSYSAAMMAVNNLRDRVGDSDAGKKTLAVVFGEAWAVKVPVIFIFLGLAVAAALGFLLLGSLSIIGTSILAIFAFKSIVPKILSKQSEDLNESLKKISLFNLVTSLLFLAWAI